MSAGAEGPDELLDEAAELALASLDLAAPAMAPPAGLLARVEAAIDADAPFVAQRLDGGRWRTLGPGVQMKRVWERAFLLKCEPGAVVPDHDHPSFEHALVVSGDLISEMGVFGPGDYHGVPAGAKHRPWTTKAGCVVLVQYAA